MAMTIEPCPFCGSTKVDTASVANIGYAVSCNGCGASSEIGPPVESAIAKWNRRAHLTQPAQAVDVGFDNALNDAGWAFIEAMPVPLPGPVFNNVKTALKAAIEKWLATRALAGEQAGWRTVPGKYKWICDAFDGMSTGRAERFLECLGIDGDACKPLDELIPASPTPDKETQR